MLPNRKVALEAEGVSSPSTKKNLNVIMSTLKEVHDDMKGRTNIQRKRKKDFIKYFAQKIKDKEMTKIFCSSTGIKRKYFTEGCLDDRARRRRKYSIPLMIEHNITEYFKSEANSKTIPDKKSVKKTFNRGMFFRRHLEGHGEIGMMNTQHKRCHLQHFANCSLKMV